MSESKSIYDIIFKRPFERGQPIYCGGHIAAKLPTRMNFASLKVNAIYVNEQKRTVVVVFNNGHKKIVKCSPKDEFDAEVGFALAIAREFVGEKMKVSEFVAKKAKVIKAAPVKKKKKNGEKTNTVENTAPKKRGRKPKAESQKEENK